MFERFKYEYEFLESKITQQTSPEEGYRRFELMATKQIDTLRKLTKQVYWSFILWYFILLLLNAIIVKYAFCLYLIALFMPIYLIEFWD